MNNDLISRQAAIEHLKKRLYETALNNVTEHPYYEEMADNRVSVWLKEVPSAQPYTDEEIQAMQDLEQAQLDKAYQIGVEEGLQSAQPEQTDCEYCHEDSDGYVKPIEKNNHAFVRFGMDGWELDLTANGWHGRAKIRYCPMCGRDLLVK